MNDYLSSAPIVLHVVREPECLLTEDCGKLLLFLNLLFVKDSAELIEGVLCVTAQRRDISCVGFSRMSIVPAAVMAFLLLSVFPMMGVERAGRAARWCYIQLISCIPYLV